jgi:hypothetical protein
MSNFEFEIRDRDGISVILKTLKSDSAPHYARISINDAYGPGEPADLDEPQLRTLAIALNMAADELKERGK